MRTTLVVAVTCLLLAAWCAPVLAYVPSNVTYLYEYAPPGGPWMLAAADADTDSLGAPTWQNQSTLHIPDQRDPSVKRHLWLEIVFMGPAPGSDNYFPELMPGGGDGWTMSGGNSVIGNVMTWEYLFDPRPSYETIYIHGLNGYQDNDFYALRGISKIRLGAITVPEPSMLLALLCGVGGLAIRRKRR